MRARQIEYFLSRNQELRRSARSEGSLSRWHAHYAIVKSNGIAQCARNRLELRLDNVMGISPFEYADMQAHPRLGNEGFPDMSRQGGVVCSDQLHNLRLSVYEIRAPREVNRCLHETFIKGNKCITKASDAGLIPERFTERLSHG
jgi:hypothetical protein